MDNLHNALMEKLKEESKETEKFQELWREELAKTAQLEQQRKQDSENIIKLAKYVDDKDAEIATLKAKLAEVEEQNNPHNCECEPVCDIPMKA